MINDEIIEQFYKDVESLKLKFPVAAIAKETGFSKGNVSQYLNKKDEPSENFIKAFYKSFKLVSRENKQEPVKTAPGTELMELVQSNKLLAEAMKISAQSQLVDAESRKKLVENNGSLADILKITVNAAPETQQAEQPIPLSVLEVLAELSVAGKIYKTKPEALAQLGIRFHSSGKNKRSGNVAGVGR